MARLVELDLGDGQIVLVEAKEGVSVPRSTVPYKRTAWEMDTKARFDAVRETLRSFTSRTVQALRDADADLETVTFEFGISLGGESGVPYITRGKAESALFVTVQCNLAQGDKRLSREAE